ncbi:MAG TPA: tetratricopeptide repeat protein [Methylomirabilota bacterium]|nr:tetratricopeptide repeat protein [Methylomirabilota bacterium]
MRMLSATLGLAVLGVVLVGCSTTSDVAMKRGADAYRTGEYVAAADAFGDAIAANPKSAAAWNDRAAARLRMGDVRGAISDYNRAIELAPHDAEIYFNRGNALVAAGLYQEAIADFTRAADINPSYAKALFNRGTVYSMLGQRDAAEADWNRAIALEPDPWTKSSMRRSAGLDPTPVVAMPAPEIQQPVIAPAPAPGTRAASPPPLVAPIPANPPVAPITPPAVALAPMPAPAPAASVQALDARALASRAITRELDGDHAGAMQDLATAMQLEPDAQRRAAIANLIRVLDTPR